jgi:hypothetical protein
MQQKRTLAQTIPAKRLSILCLTRSDYKETRDKLYSLSYILREVEDLFGKTNRKTTRTKSGCSAMPVVSLATMGEK